LGAGTEQDSIQQGVSERKIRPFAAWTAPTCRNPELVNKELMEVNWEALKGRELSNLELDASLLACKRADHSFSLIDMVPGMNQPGGIRQYNGIYIGAEKIWVKDIIRPEPSERFAKEDVIFVKQINEIPTQPMHEGDDPSPTIIIVGEQWR